VGSLLNPRRPPVFCPGCSHERSLHALDKAFERLSLAPSDVVLVSDIGCSGLFDIFFDTHAFHGLHGRALTYAAGIKLARPHLKVLVAMGDGGLGIGGAHLLAACRRNLDLVLLILNNFNFGMTGGQFSCTTPETASVPSGFLNTLEKPMDVCTVAASAGAPFVSRCSVYGKELPEVLEAAIRFEGFSLVDIWGICTGRYVKRNPLSPGALETAQRRLPPFEGEVAGNIRPEYGRGYCGKQRSLAAGLADQRQMEAEFQPPVTERREVVSLGAAGQRVISAGALLAHASILAGMHVSQKNDYNITVMRGPSISELILCPEPIAYTGVEQPDVIVALAPEGVKQRHDLFEKIKPGGRVIVAKGVDIPPAKAQVQHVDFAAHGVKTNELPLAALALLAACGDPLTPETLECAVRHSFTGKSLEASLGLIRKMGRSPER
jgi:2-oxoglutarate/2-oxoacid ferredoxin oxidoreductase subunit beta